MNPALISSQDTEMTYQSALVMTIHRVLAQNRINLAAIAKVTQIPLATIRRVTSPATAPTGLAAWESLLRAIGASVHVEFQGAPSQVDLPDLHAKHLHAVHERLVDRAYAEPSSNLGHRRPKTRVSRKQVSRETTALRNRIVQILDDSLPTGRHRTTSLFAPVAAMISGVAAAGVMGRSFDTLELVTGVPGRTHRQLCTPDEQRPIAILQTVLGMAGVVVVVEHQKARWEIGHSTPVAAPAFLKTTNHQTGATRGAPSHEHLPLAPSQILNALLGERPIFQDLVIAATRAGISATTIRSWERRRRDPLLEALETMTAALRHQQFVAGYQQFPDQFAGILVVDHRAAGHPDPEIVAGFADAIAAGARLAVARFEMSLEAEVDQGVQLTIGANLDAAAVAAVAAVRATEFDELLAPETQTAVTALAGGNVDFCLIDEFHHFTLLREVNAAPNRRHRAWTQNSGRRCKRCTEHPRN